MGTNIPGVKFLIMMNAIDAFNPKLTGEGQICPYLLTSSIISKNFRATYYETLYKFLLYTYEDSCNSIWSKKILGGM